MASIIELNGEWLIEGREGDVVYPRLEGFVPGSVYLAALDEGLIASSTDGFQALQNRWLDQRVWRYSRSFTIQPDVAQNRFFLHIGKTLPNARVFVNGEQIPFCWDGMDITSAAREGENELFVEMEGAAFLQDVRIDCFSMARIEQIRFRWQEDGGLRCEISANAWEPGKYILQYRLTQSGEAVCGLDIPLVLRAGQNTFSHTLQVPASSAGQRIQAIVQLEKLSVRAHRVVLHIARTDWTVEGEDFQPSGLQGLVWHANHRKDKEALLAMCKRCHINCLLVCGLETDAFYDQCDALQIAVWQEPDAYLPLEVWESVIRRLRSHPCLLCLSPGEYFFADGQVADARHPAIFAFLQSMRGLVDIPLSATRPANILSEAAFAPEGAEQWFALEEAKRVLQPEQPDWERLEDELGSLESDQGLPVRVTRFLQAALLRRACEAVKRNHSDDGSIFIEGIFGESGQYGSTLLDGSLPRPAFTALRAAFAPRALYASLESITFQPGDALETDITLRCELDEVITVECALYDMQGRQLEQQIYTTRSLPPITRMGRYACTLSTSGLFLLRLESKIEGQTIRGEYTLCVSEEQPLLPMRKAPMLHLSVQSGEEGRFLANNSEIMALGIHLPDGFLPDGYLALLPLEQAPIGTTPIGAAPIGAAPSGATPLKTGGAEKPEMLNPSL